MSNYDDEAQAFDADNQEAASQEAEARANEQADQEFKEVLVWEGIKQTHEMVDEYIDGLHTTVGVIGHSSRELAMALKHHKEMVAALKQSEGVIEEALIKRGVAYGGEHIQGVGFVQIRRTGAKVVYDNLALISRITATLAIDHTEKRVDEETGEVIPFDAKEAIQNAVREALDYAATDTKSYNSWRKTKLAAIGILADKYLEKEGGRLTVDITEFDPENGTKK